MRYVIEEASTTEAGHLYIVVSFQANNGTHLAREDFIIGRPQILREYIGAEGPNGERLDHDAYQESIYDIRSEVQAIIRRYIQAHPEIDTGDGQDKTDPNIRRDRSDHRGHISQISDLIGRVQRP